MVSTDSKALAIRRILAALSGRYGTGVAAVGPHKCSIDLPPGLLVVGRCAEDCYRVAVWPATPAEPVVKARPGRLTTLEGDERFQVCSLRSRRAVT